MLRVLQIFGEPIANGGQESYIMNMYRHIDREQVQFDFFTPFTVDNAATKAEIESLGGNVFCSGYTFGEDNNRFFKLGVSDFLKEHRYEFVHIHSGSTFALMEGSRIARKSGASRVAVHSHCGGFVNLKYRVIRLISRASLLKYPTDYFACSHLAARWKFPKPIIDNERYKVLKNAVDTTAFHYDAFARERLRDELGLADKLVVGHVGRFALQKNHDFLIDIFAAVLKKKPNACLLLVGEGELMQSVRDKIDALGITDSVRFLGIRRDINELMNAFDVFALPSFFEGLPVVGVEAQATGLPVVTSTGVTPELPLDELARYIPLEAGADRWADEVIAAACTDRQSTTERIIDAGYDVVQAAKYMQRCYEEK